MSETTKQPLYVPPEERVTLDEMKSHVERIQNLALTQGKQVVSDVYEQNVTRAALVAVGAVLVAASVAYYLGTRASRRMIVTTEP